MAMNIPISNSSLINYGIQENKNFTIKKCRKKYQKNPVTLLYNSKISTPLCMPIINNMTTKKNNQMTIHNTFNITNKCNPNFENNRFKKSRIPFTKEEDERIIKLTEMYGTKQWKLIASYIPGRSSKQCRDRYSNYLVPGYFKGEWSKEEDELLIKLHEQIGSKWSILQKSFPERSANSVKNRWNYFLCRQNNENVKVNEFYNLDDLDKNDNDEFIDFKSMDFLYQECGSLQNDDTDQIQLFYVND